MKDMLGRLVRKVADLPLEMLGVLCDLAEKLSSDAGQQWLAELKSFLRKENCWTGAVKESFLRLISGGQELMLDAVDGTATLFEAKDVFAWRDPDFENWEANESGRATSETPVEVRELVGDATFAQMFGELNVDVRKLCLTQHQIKEFVQRHRNWLRTEGYATFFLFESKRHFFVAYVNFHSDGSLYVYVFRFEHDFVWHAERRHRVVVPRLA